MVVATFLATPYAWDYDCVVLVFAAAWLGRQGLKTGFLPWERIALVGLLVLPALTLAVSVSAGVQLGPVMLWLVFFVLIRRAVGNPAALGAAAAARAGAR